MKRGDEIIGWGMATATWHAGRSTATVRVRLNADGTARATCATQDIGTGTHTIFAQVVSEKPAFQSRRSKSSSATAPYPMARLPAAQP
jgi:CO/xanthine dehydrogenase Mo-binding subunit